MKSFLKKRWHSIPVALVSALLVLALVAGGAFAAYQFFTMPAEVTVLEGCVVGANGGEGMEPPPGEDLGIGGGYTVIETPYAFTVTLYPGESTRITDNHPMHGARWFNSIAIRNDSSADITVKFVIPESYDGVRVVSWEAGESYNLNGYTFTIPGSGPVEHFIMRGLGVEADEDAAPGVYTFTVKITRG